MIVLIFFALSAAICLQLIVTGHQKSEYGNDLRFAMQEGGNVVESIQATHVIPSTYEVTKDEKQYTINITRSVVEGIVQGDVIVMQEGEELLRLPFAFGEVVQ